MGLDKVLLWLGIVQVVVAAVVGLSVRSYAVGKYAQRLADDSQALSALKAQLIALEQSLHAQIASAEKQLLAQLRDEHATWREHADETSAMLTTLRVNHATMQEAIAGLRVAMDRRA